MSVRTDEEELKLLLEDIERLPEHEQMALKEVYAQLITGDEEPYNGLASAEYRVAPVDIKTFLSEPYFLGETGASLWPRLADDIVELFEGEYEEAALGGSLGWGKCLDSLSFFVSGETGERIEVGQAVGKTPLVPSLGKGEIGHQEANRIWASGRKQCARLELASGQWLEASLDHPVLTPKGYRGLQGLKKGDFVAVARRVPAPEKSLVVSDDEVVVAAALIADGGMTGGNTIYTKCKELCTEVLNHACMIRGFLGAGRETDNSINLKGLQKWTDSLGIRCLSKEKRVPPKWFGLNDEQLALFLRWLFTDGNVYTGNPRKIELTLASEGLIDDVQYLLRRFGIVARKSYRRKKNQDGEFDAWRLQIADVPNQLAFMAKVGFIPGKEDACVRLVMQANAVKKPNSNWDVVPITNEELKEIRRETGPHPNKTWTQWAGQADGSCMGGTRFKRLCCLTGYQGRYRKFADMANDVVWERVESITDIGIRDVYDLSVPETQNAVVNGIIVHNSFFSTTAMAYVIYQMSCLKNPQRAYGIDIGSHIYVAMISVTEKVAKRVVINELIGKVRHSRYFQDHFKPKEAPSQLEVRFPSNIQVVAGSTSSSALIGLNVFAGLLDETSFLGESKRLDRHGREVVVDMGESIYKSIIRRMKSRFQRVGRLPGVLILASSKERPSAFIEKRVQAAREIDDPMMFIREYATWDVHAAEKFSGKYFQVVVGTERISSRILSGDPEELKRYQDLGLQIVDVPEDYRNDFVNDIDGALRDIAGVATDVISQYMNRTEKVYDCQDATLEHPIGADDASGTMEQWVANTPLPIMWHRITSPFKRRLPGGYEEDAWRPIRHPEAVRYAHIDPSYSGDCSGICIAHIAGWAEVVRRDAMGEEYNELAPRIEVDLVLRVVPPPGDEIMLADLRGVIYQYMAHGFNVGYVSLDSFQSIDTIQQLRKHGVDAEVVSVDKTTEPYDCLKAAMYEDRFRMPPHSIALGEFRYLQRVPKSGGKIKIDHPKKNPDGTPGTKDVADAVAGVVYSLTKKVPGRPMAPMLSGRSSVDEQIDDSWVTGGKILVQSTKTSGKRQSLVSDYDGAAGAPSSLPFLKG